jgi:hypothetical protein
LQSDAAYREDARFRFMTDHFFAAECMGFMEFNRKVHQAAVDLFFPKNPNVSIEEQHPIKFRMHLDPRKTFKTTLGLVDTAQWIAAQSSRLTLLYETATQPLAASMMRVTVQHFGRGILGCMFPEIAFTKRQREDCYDSDTRTEPSIDPSVGYTSPGSAQAGWHPYLMNVDDAVDAVNSGIHAPDESRLKLISTHDTNKNLLRAGGYMNIRGTRYHPFDLYGHELEAMNPKKWRTLIRSSITVKDGSRLMPGQFPDIDDVVVNFGELREMDYYSLRDLFFANYETFMSQQQNDPMGGAIASFEEKVFEACQMAPEKLPPIGDIYLCWRMPYGGKPCMATHDEAALARIVNGKVYILEAWRGVYGTTTRAERIVKAMREHEADGLILEALPGTEYIAANIRNEALKRNLSVRIQWVEFEEDDNRRNAAMLQCEPLMRSGRLLFSTAMGHHADCRKQFLNFGLVQENGIVDCISKLAERVPISLLRANMTEAEIEYQREVRENAQWNAIFEQMGMPDIEEKERQQAEATALAMNAVNDLGFPPLPGGLDG